MEALFFSDRYKIKIHNKRTPQALFISFQRIYTLLIHVRYCQALS